MINKRQKMFLHIYQQAAALSGPDYRHLLDVHTGCRSSTDPRFSNADFEVCMAALESALFGRVEQGRIADPIGRSRHIRSRTHWRDRLPHRGEINSRQSHRIRELKAKLWGQLPADKCNEDYFLGIVNKATGRDRDQPIHALTSHEANLVIHALQDRLAYAIRKAPA